MLSKKTKYINKK